MMKRAALVLVAVFFAAATAVGVSALQPSVAQAGGGGKVKKCGGGSILLNAKEKEVFHLHNNKRKQRNLKPLCIHPRLQKAARAHSKDMIRRDYFSHDTKGGGSFKQRLRRFGYKNYSLIAENIAGGNGSKGKPGNIMRGWMESPGHRRNILNGKFREAGIGAYTGKYKTHRGWTMYTVDFGRRR